MKINLGIDIVAEEIVGDAGSYYRITLQLPLEGGKILKDVLFYSIDNEQDTTEYLMSNPETAKRLLDSIEELNAGKGIMFDDLEDLKRKVDNLPPAAEL